MLETVASISWATQLPGLTAGAALMWLCFLFFFPCTDQGPCGVPGQMRGAVSSYGESPGDCSDWLLSAPADGPDSWEMLKTVNKPSMCTVRGYPIEELDPENNFRRSRALGFQTEKEDCASLLPFVLAAHDLSLHTSKRRVLLDLGGNRFDTSVTWFSRQYPLDFTEVHVFEAKPGRFKLPRHSKPGQTFLRPMNNASLRVKEGHPPPIPNFLLDRIQVYNKIVGAADGESKWMGEKVAVVNITRFIKEELNITDSDAFIVKMDIEGTEWNILPEWIRDEEMVLLVDELFVEVHYVHPTMAAFHWDDFKGHTREDATQLMIDLRSRGYYVHAWP